MKVPSYVFCFIQNKKQRIMVRMAVLKGKDPLKLIEEMDAIDEMGNLSIYT